MVRHSLDKITTQLGLDKCSCILDKMSRRVISRNTKVKFERKGKRIREKEREVREKKQRVKLVLRTNIASFLLLIFTLYHNKITSPFSLSW